MPSTPPPRTQFPQPNPTLLTSYGVVVAVDFFDVLDKNITVDSIPGNVLLAEITADLVVLNLLAIELVILGQPPWNAY